MDDDILTRNVWYFTSICHHLNINWLKAEGHMTIKRREGICWLFNWLRNSDDGDMSVVDGWRNWSNYLSINWCYVWKSLKSNQLQWSLSFPTLWTKARNKINISETEEEIQPLEEIIIKETEYVGLKVIDLKRKYIRLGKELAGNNRDTDIFQINIYDLKIVNGSHHWWGVSLFKYLGFILSDKTSEDIEIQSSYKQ